jgi:hypothetical protein
VNDSTNDTPYMQRTDPTQFSVLELSIVNVMESMKALDLYVPVVTPAQCAEFALTHNLGCV